MKITVLFLCFFLFGETYSQTDLANKINVASFVEPSLKITELNNQSAFLIGIKLDWILDNNYEIGAKLNVFKGNNPPFEQIGNPSTPEMILVYLGVEPGYKLSFSNMFSIYTSIFVGYGYTNYSHASGTYTGKYFWIVEPNVSIGYQFVKWFEIKMGISYRNAFNVDKIHYSTTTVGFSAGEYDVPIETNNLSLDIGFRFGL